MNLLVYRLLEAETAKNYLTKDELDMLNRMVTAFLEIAEIQALDRTPMYMADWIKQLDTKSDKLPSKIRNTRTCE
jgi:hypothetical protein